MMKETTKLLRILCLHGSEQNAEILRTRLGSIPRKSKAFAKFVFIDAPHALPLRPGDDVPLRTWYLRNEKGELNESSLQTSLDYVKSVWDDTSDGNGSFDGIFGFSMGGTVAAQVALLKSQQQKANRPDPSGHNKSSSDCYNSLKFIFVAGAPDRLATFPSSTSHPSLPSSGASSGTEMDPSLYSLHVMGQSDNVVSMALMQSLAARFHEPEVIVHEQGHCLPSKAVYIDKYVDFLKRMHGLFCTGGGGGGGDSNNVTVTGLGIGKDSVKVSSDDSAKSGKPKKKKTDVVAAAATTAATGAGAAAAVPETGIATEPPVTPVIVPVVPPVSNLEQQYEELEALLAIYDPGVDPDCSGDDSSGSVIRVMGAHAGLLACDSSGLLITVVPLAEPTIPPADASGSAGGAADRGADRGAGGGAGSASGGASGGAVSRERIQYVHIPTLKLKILLTSAGSCGYPEAWQGKLALQITLFGHYPSPVDSESNDYNQPRIQCALDLSNLSILDFPTSYQQSLLAKCRSVILEQSGPDSSGNMCIYDLVQAGLDWVANPQEWDSRAEHTAAVKVTASAKCTEVTTGDVEQEEELPELEEEVEAEDPAQTLQWIRSATEEAHSVAYQLLLEREKNDRLYGQGQQASQQHGLQTGGGGGGVGGGSKRRQGGIWSYTVGLVGKPSAGKSTFYNAVTRAALVRDGRGYAPVSPHPFTTITPNVGPGWFLGPRDDTLELDAGALGAFDTTDGLLQYPNNYSQQPPVVTCRGAAYGRDNGANGTGAGTNRRLLPVRVKDVAGLVPGAYNGRGKGNRFLNDLCDADVLIHIVDASGSATAEGTILAVTDTDTDTDSGARTGADAGTTSSGSGGLGSNSECSKPHEDMQWVREELHRWIYNNITAKWSSIERKYKGGAKARGQGGGVVMQGNSGACQRSSLERLYACMSGYQGSIKDDVDEAIQRAQLGSIGAAIGQWSASDRHRFVAHYLSVRFPTCIALNKIDKIFAAAAIADVTMDSSGVTNKSNSSNSNNNNRNSNNTNVSAIDLNYIKSLVAAARKRGEVAIPVSAQAEEWSIRKQRLKGISVMKATSSNRNSTAATPGISVVEKISQSHLSSCSDAEFRSMERILQVMQHRPVLEKAENIDKTNAGVGIEMGVLNVVTAAVMLKPPLFVYPVQDLDSEAPLGYSHAAAAIASAIASASASAGAGASCVSSPLQLTHCIMCRPGSTVYDLYQDLTRTVMTQTLQVPTHTSAVMTTGDVVSTVDATASLSSSSAEEVHFLCGDYVRCDGTSLTHTRKHQCGRDTVIQPSISVLRIQTNKKVSWQKNYVK